MSLRKIISNFKRNFDIFFLLIIILTAGISIQTYNSYKIQKKENFSNILDNIYFKKTLTYMFDNFDSRYLTIKHKVSSGESLNVILEKYEIPKLEIKKIKKELSKKKNLNNLKINQLIEFTIDKGNQKKVINFFFPISRTKKIQLVRNLKNDNFEAKEITKNLNKKIIFKEGKISQSLYRSAIKSNIQPNIIVEFARIYGFQIDFQRDIRKNDAYQIIYEIFQDEDGKIFETGKIIFANLILSGQENSLYFFIDKKKNGEHYDLNGKSVRKALMKTPINGARLSSSFGMRKAPDTWF